MIELHPSRIPDDLKKFFRPKRKYGSWIIRNCVIWHKPNPMPSSAKDRFTVDYEVVWFLVKNKRYWFEPQYEPYNYDGRHKTTLEPTRKYGSRNYSLDNPQQMARQPMERWPCPLGRNKRAVWTIPTQSCPEAHFATFPEKLVEPMLKSGCPEFVCTKCGKARVKVYDRPIPPENVMTNNKQTDDKLVKTSANRYGKGQGQKRQNWSNEHPPTFKGYTDCGCGKEFRPGIILDMFGGAMTTAVVAYKHRRDYIMIELSKAYVKMGKGRLKREREKFSLLENTK